VARSRKESKRSGERLGALPWAVLLQAGLVVGRRLGELSAKDRARLARLVRESRGRPGSLSEKEREELRKLAKKLDLRSMGRELMPLVRGRGRKRR
jgi:hypothetical protein